MTVKVDHKEFADSRWYTGSGIYRNVYLVEKTPVHIPSWGVQFSTTSVTKTGADAHVNVYTKNAGSKKANITLQCKLTDSKGITVANGGRQLSINVADSIPTNLSFHITNPSLWSVDHPALYQLSVSLVENGKTIDSYSEAVGIRSIRLDADSGFFLNEENMKLKGVCIHDDAGALGVAVPEAVWRRRLNTLKDLGCNSLRMSHNPHADYLYKLCDELGFLVLDEAFDEWETGKNKWIKGWNVGTPGKDGYHEYFKEWADIDVRDMILRNYNHPSIIGWSIGNEIDYPNDPYSHEVLSTGNNPQIYGKGYLPDHPPASRLGELSKQLAAVVKNYDTTRPVTAALAGVVMSNTTTYPENLDWVGYNYQEYRYAEDHAKYPNRIIYGSENGMALKAWNAVDSNQFISGQYLWTGIDYLGEAGRWPQRSSGAGLIDLAGFPKPEYYFRQSLWSNQPMSYIGVTKISTEEDKSIWRHLKAEPTWNWNRGDKLRINSFTNCSEAELFLNEKSFGRKSMSDFPNHIISWDVDYEPGEIEVKGYNNGVANTTYSLKTTGEATSINAYAEKDTIGKTNLVQVIIQINDKAGNRVYNADNEITVTLPRGAVLLGLESGSTTSHEDYKANKRKSLHGRMIAYIQLSTSAKHADVVISSPGLSSYTIKLD
jgi:beta-galactosidase/beta-glucuronidase